MNIGHYFVEIINAPIVYAEVPTNTRVSSLPFCSLFKNNSHPALIVPIWYPWFVLCSFPYFLATEWSGLSHLPGLAGEATRFPCCEQPVFINDSACEEGSPPHCSCHKSYLHFKMVRNGESFSGHLLCTNSSTPNPSSQLKMEGLWLIQLMQKMAKCLASFKYSMLSAHRLQASVREKWQGTWPFSRNRVWKGGIKLPTIALELASTYRFPLH